MPSNAPERLWLDPAAGEWLTCEEVGSDTDGLIGYVRADILAARDAEIARLNATIDAAEAEMRRRGSSLYLRNVRVATEETERRIADLLAPLDTAREALRLAAPIIRLNLSRAWNSGDVAGYEASIAALRAIVAILPDALDGAPEWIKTAVAEEKRDA